MKTTRFNPNHYSVWGNALLNKLPAVSRRRRKRPASKLRRRDARRAIERALAADCCDP